MANFNQNLEFCGLGTLSFTIPVAGPYFVEGHMSIPALSKGDTGASALLVVCNLNGGAAFYTGLAGAEGFKADFTGAVGDVLNMVFSSSAAVDQPLNVIKSQISLGIGE